MQLAPTDAAVRSVQLYRGREATLPVMQLDRRGERTSEPLTLEFDLVNTRGRTLSVYFYHADRSWNRDLSPAEYLEAFQQDNLVEYEISGATEVPYVHYEYTFPNETIQFRISGNYIVRVTEQGDEEAVLFERAFVSSPSCTPSRGAVLTGQHIWRLGPGATSCSARRRSAACSCRRGSS